MADPGFGAQRTVLVSSPSFQQGQPIPPQFTCDGTDVSPQLLFTKVPPAAKTLALIVDDPDAPGRPEPWVHWTIWNLPPETTILEEGVDVRKLGARQGLTDFGRTGYGGPCPPPGRHRYFFRVYACDAVLTLAEKAAFRDLKRALQGHVLAWGELMGTYQRA